MRSLPTRLRSASQGYSLIVAWAASFFGVVAAVRSDYLAVWLVLCATLGLAASVQLAHHKGYPRWMGVFAMFVGGPLFVIALPKLPKADAPQSPPA